MSKQVTLTPAQMEALAPQSGQLHRALYAGWAKPIYSPEMAVLQKVWRELTGARIDHVADHALITWLNMH